MLEEDLVAERLRALALVGVGAAVGRRLVGAELVTGGRASNSSVSSIVPATSTMVEPSSAIGMTRSGGVVAADEDGVAKAGAGGVGGRGEPGRAGRGDDRAGEAEAARLGDSDRQPAVFLGAGRVLPLDLPEQAATDVVGEAGRQQRRVPLPERDDLGRIVDRQQIDESPDPRQVAVEPAVGEVVAERDDRRRSAGRGGGTGRSELRRRTPCRRSRSVPSTAAPAGGDRVRVEVGS